VGIMAVVACGGLYWVFAQFVSPVS
jgi:hypothetical protein